jgi:hypothetical protein
MKKFLQIGERLHYHCLPGHHLYPAQSCHPARQDLAASMSESGDCMWLVCGRYLTHEEFKLIIKVDHRKVGG